MLTKEELDVLDKLTTAWAAFNNLPLMHPDDIHEFRLSFHNLQNIIMIRSAVREHPERFINKSLDKK
jgi:hypothetical protein